MAIPVDFIRPPRCGRPALDDNARAVEDPVSTELEIPMVLGSSPAIGRVQALIEQAAPTAVSVFIYGESGTGKELVAQTIHRLSRRAAHPFVATNLAAVPETLLESELFGHEKGAFTGAIEQRPGCFELAHRGTLFLDELTEMTPATQVKLLRVLQERRFRRVGGRQERGADVRVIAAANVDPLDAIADGRLRVDLYYRLNVFALAVPPLRARRADIPALVQAFVDEFNGRYGKSVAAIDPAVMEIFDEYPWPGNVRELRNVIERAMIVAAGDLIGIEHLPPALLDPQRKGPAMRTLTLPPGTTVQQAERQLILLTLEHTGYNKTHAAALLGISVKTLYNKLQHCTNRQLSG